MISTKIKDAICLANKYPNIKKVGVFGSCARDEETADSDIDIIIHYNSETDDFLDDIDNFMEDFENVINDVKVDYITLNGIEKSKNSQIKENILKDVIWIYDKEG